MIRDAASSPLALFQNIGLPELLIILFVALLIFGGRLPGLARSLGQSFTQFRKGLRESDEPGKGPSSPGGDSNGSSR